MLTFFTICVALLTIGIFLHLLSAFDKSQLNKKEQERLQRENNFDGADPRSVYGKNWDKNVQPPRICPCCGKALKKTEFLYAAMGNQNESTGKKQVHIYGCRYCYLGQVDENLSAQEKAEETLDF